MLTFSTQCKYDHLKSFSICTIFCDYTETVKSTDLKLYINVPDSCGKIFCKLRHSILHITKAVCISHKIHFSSMETSFDCFRIWKSVKYISMILQMRTWFCFDIWQPLGWEAAPQTFKIFQFHYLHQRSRSAGVSYL